LFSKPWLLAGGYFGSKLTLQNSSSKLIPCEPVEMRRNVPMYSSKFLKAFDYLMHHEGGYSNDHNDAGGETKFGISKRSYPNLDIKNLTRDQACQIYFVDFWMKGKYEQIEDENIAIKLFDLAVHIGIQQAVKLVQRALRAVGTQVAEDGIIGSITLKAINESDPTDLLAALKSESAGYYRLLANANPSQKKFIDGWLRRAYDNV
jgi:lysozyme family protein